MIVVGAVDVLPFLAAVSSGPLYFVSGRAGRRWARWRDLRCQERDIDRAEREARTYLARTVPTSRYPNGRVVRKPAVPPAGPSGVSCRPPLGGAGVASRRYVPNGYQVDWRARAARHRERQNEAAIRAGRGVVSLDVPSPPVVDSFDDWGSSDWQSW